MSETEKIIVIIEFLTKIFKMITRVAITFIIAHYTYLSIKTLAGTTTNANFILSFIMERNNSEKISYAANLFLLLLWFLERRSRNSLIKSKSKETDDLRFQIDKNKGTSNLTREGYTNEKDK